MKVGNSTLCITGIDSLVRSSSDGVGQKLDYSVVKSEREERN